MSLIYIYIYISDIYIFLEQGISFDYSERINSTRLFSNQVKNINMIHQFTLKMLSLNTCLCYLHLWQQSYVINLSLV